MNEKKNVDPNGGRKQDCIYFEEGLFGFEKCKRFLPVPVEEGSDMVLTLHSLEQEEISFVLMNPFCLREDYDPRVPSRELEVLGEADETEYSWYVICTARSPIEESTVNLRCPIVVNVRTRKAKQVILEDKTYHFRHRLKDLRGEGGGC